MRTKMQIIFQDPYSSLSPRLPVGEIIGEAVKEHNLVPKNEYQDYITKIMNDCGLQSYHKDRYPHEFSGGQRQRLTIARALVKKPEILILDDSLSALDFATDAALRKALAGLEGETTTFLVSQRVAGIRQADKILVLDNGELAGSGTHDELMKSCEVYREIYFSQFPEDRAKYERGEM